ncbi:DUF3576 domain-containing protein [Ruegeria pomeroyi]|uniref:DUF3576 domain-containing protein n=1 Tax=Ruegeria pomeroyi TaxID=89184 RepID=A0A9Q3ZMX7_9RHOB|nr:DUF3576 domain-containing protein [Ruegeria pomeroyi]MCE8538558.1 DUF3576 domain-containing protein [Ruegeria pomeroyi]
MTLQNAFRTTLVLALGLGLAACGNRGGGVRIADAPPADDSYITNNRESAPTNYEKSSIWDVFGPSKAEQTVQVNRYLWAASLDVLSFLPIQSVDPFTGVIVTGYGTPPGGGRSYRATVHIKDPALEARALKVSLQTSGGAPVNAATARAVEDAILSRARQLRIGDDKL